jgi:hypothetical protein
MLRIVALLCTCVLAASACGRTTPPSASPDDHTSTDERNTWVLHTDLSRCHGMPWFVSVVRDFDDDGRDDLLLGCSDELTVSFGGPNTLQPGIQIDALDRLLYSAASLDRGPRPAFLLGGDRTTSVIVVEAERGEQGWEATTRLVELDAWRDDADEQRGTPVQVLSDEGALREGIAYAAGPGAVVEFEWSSETRALQVLRTWPVPEAGVGAFDRLLLADLRGDGERSLVVVAQARPTSNLTGLVVIEWPTRQNAGRLELGEPSQHSVTHALASLPITTGGEPGLPLRLKDGGVALLRLVDDRFDTQLELFAPQGLETTPLALFVDRPQSASSDRLCALVVAKHYATDHNRVLFSFGSVSQFVVEDGSVAWSRSFSLAEGFSLGAAFRGDFDGDGRPETLFVDEYHPQHIVSRSVIRGC